MKNIERGAAEKWFGFWPMCLEVAFTRSNFLRTYCDCYQLPVYCVTGCREYKTPSKVRNDRGGLLRQSASWPKHQAHE